MNDDMSTKDVADVIDIRKSKEVFQKKICGTDRKTIGIGAGK